MLLTFAAWQTLPIGIASQITRFQTLWGQMMAAAVLYLLPVLAVSLLAQRGLVRGLMSGATNSIRADQHAKRGRGNLFRAAPSNGALRSAIAVRTIGEPQ